MYSLLNIFSGNILQLESGFCVWIELLIYNFISLFLIELPYNDYFEYFGPDFKLHISPSNMTNQNTPEYMEKIKQRLFENLHMLPHAPGVQMQAIPEDAVHEDSGDEDGEDPDKRISSKIVL